MLIDHILTREPIDKGWSGDQKYRIADNKGNPYLLRTSPMEQYERKRNQFLRMERAAGLGIPMCLPLEFGTCTDGVYSIQSWINGNDAENVIPALPAERQYTYGSDAGRILRELHTLPAPADAEHWSRRFNRKIDRKIKMYTECPLKYDDGELFITHIQKFRHLLTDRPQTYQHGDYHIGNMMVDVNGVLTIIDFEKDDWGDPWEEFNRIVWCAQKAPYFAAGMVDGYFDGEVPQKFWDLLALYICSNTLSSLPWAVSYGEREISVMRRQAKEVLQWYDDLRSTIPIWYKKP